MPASVYINNWFLTALMHHKKTEDFFIRTYRPSQQYKSSH